MSYLNTCIFVTSLVLTGIDIAQALSSVKRIRSLRRLKETDQDLDPLPEIDEDKGLHGPKIELRDVFFKYPTRDVPVLCGLNMTASLSLRSSRLSLMCYRSKEDSLPP